MHAAIDQLVLEGQLTSLGMPATGALVETLLERGTDEDVVKAEVAIDRIAVAPSEGGSTLRDIWLLVTPRPSRARSGRRRHLPRLSGSLPEDGQRLGFEATCSGPRRCDDHRGPSGW